MLGDIDHKNFFKNLKLRVRYFFGTPYNILREKRIKDSKGHG